MSGHHLPALSRAVSRAMGGDPLGDLLQERGRNVLKDPRGPPRAAALRPDPIPVVGDQGCNCSNCLAHSGRAKWLSFRSHVRVAAGSRRHHSRSPGCRYRSTGEAAPNSSIKAGHLPRPTIGFRPEWPAAVDRLQLPSAGSSTRRTPIVEPNSPANILPFNERTRVPNIGFTTTAGSAGITDRNSALSCSVGFGFACDHCPRPTAPVMNFRRHPTVPARRVPAARPTRPVAEMRFDKPFPMVIRYGLDSNEDAPPGRGDPHRRQTRRPSSDLVAPLVTRCAMQLHEWHARVRSPGRPNPGGRHQPATHPMKESLEKSQCARSRSSQNHRANDDHQAAEVDAHLA